MVTLSKSPLPVVASSHLGSRSLVVLYTRAHSTESSWSDVTSTGLDCFDSPPSCTLLVAEHPLLVVITSITAEPDVLQKRLRLSVVR